jgi:hypothetical protein
MNPKISILLVLILLTRVTCGAEVEKTQPRSGYLNYSFSETLFTTFAFINYAKYLLNDTAGLNPVALSVCRDLKNGLSGEFCNEIVDTYQKIKTHHDWMLGYVATVVAVQSTAPPVIKPYIEQVESFDKIHGTKNDWLLGHLEYWKTILPFLSKFWYEAGIKSLIEKYKPLYDSAGHVYLMEADTVINKSLHYLKMKPDMSVRGKHIKLIVNLIGPDGEMGPEHCDTLYDIKGYAKNTEYRPHEMLHSLIMNQTKNSKYENQIKRIVSQVWDSVKETPGAKSYSEPITYFDECLVRTLDNLIMELNNEQRNKRLEKIFENESKKGFVLVIPMWKAMEKYEAENIAFTDYFDALIAEIENNISIKGTEIK